MPDVTPKVELEVVNVPDTTELGPAPRTGVPVNAMPPLPAAMALASVAEFVVVVTVTVASAAWAYVSVISDSETTLSAQSLSQPRFFLFVLSIVWLCRRRPDTAAYPAMILEFDLHFKFVELT